MNAALVEAIGYWGIAAAGAMSVTRALLMRKGGGNSKGLRDDLESFNRTAIRIAKATEGIPAMEDAIRDHTDRLNFQDEGITSLKKGQHRLDLELIDIRRDASRLDDRLNHQNRRISDLESPQSST